MQPKKIVIIGPESTGKSTLCEQLANHYQTRCCPEFAREYLVQTAGHYDFDDLLTIAKAQVALEEKYISYFEKESLPAKDSRLTAPLLFIDTDMWVMKVWCEFVFGRCHQWILDQIVSRPYDCYLLCNTDLPWVADELREYPDLETRQQLFHIYKDLLVNQNTAWTEISGDHNQRLKTAIDAIDGLFKY